MQQHLKVDRVARVLDIDGLHVRSLVPDNVWRECRPAGLSSGEPRCGTFRRTWAARLPLNIIIERNADVGRM